MIKERITAGGSAADPPHLGHRALLELLRECGKFDKIIWILSGIRKDKKSLLSPDHRVAMTMQAFPSEWFYDQGPELIISFRDVYDVNRPTFFWLKKIKEENPNAEISWYTGVDSVVPQDRFGGMCEIERMWFNGICLMKEHTFYILSREGEGYPPISEISLPPQFRTIDGELPDISSMDIRKKIARGESFEHLVAPGVAAYIKRFDLYGWQERRD